MSDDLKLRRAERVLRCGHGRVDAVARHESYVIEFSGITVVAREMNSSAQPNFVTQLESTAAEHRDSDIAARLGYWAPLLCGPFDLDVDPIAVRLVLGLAIHASFNRDARPFHYRCDAMRRGRRR